MRHHLFLLSCWTFFRHSKNSNRYCTNYPGNYQRGAVYIVRMPFFRPSSYSIYYKCEIQSLSHPPTPKLTYHVHSPHGIHSFEGVKVIPKKLWPVTVSNAKMGAINVTTIWPEIHLLSAAGSYNFVAFSALVRYICGQRRKVWVTLIELSMFQFRPLKQYT